MDENDLEEDVDSEPAEIEGEATEEGEPGDTGAELDDGTEAQPPLSSVVNTCSPRRDTARAAAMQKEKKLL